MIFYSDLKEYLLIRIVAFHETYFVILFSFQGHGIKIECSIILFIMIHIQTSSGVTHNRIHTTSIDRCTEMATHCVSKTTKRNSRSVSIEDHMKCEGI
jgi:hypothetical protein